MNSAEKVYESNKFIADFIYCDCYESDCEVENDLEGYDEAISEVTAMIQHFIVVGNKQEVAAWRKYLNKLKIEKRRVKERMESKRKEFALT